MLSELIGLRYLDLRVLRKLMKNLLLICFGGLIALLGLTLSQHYFPEKMVTHEKDESPSTESDILYWVAPMDANFRRDQPGKSPMGMDLVPVYDNQGGSDAGVVTISSAVSSNLGIKIAEAQLEYPTLLFYSSGQVNYAKERLAHLHARTSGWVEKVHVSDIGEYVEKGQALYGIYSLEFIDAQEDFLRALNSHNNSLMRAAKNRLKALRIDNKVIALLKKTKTVNQITTFYAPQSGYIEQLNINEGMYVKPESALLTLADLDQLILDVELEHQLAAWLSQYPGDITWTLSSDLMPSQNWQGKLDYIYPMLSETLRTIRVRLLLDNSEKLLKPNMWLSLKGDITGKEKILLIPSQALIRTENKTRVVMALNNKGEGSLLDKKFKSVEVTTGRFFNDQVEILSGLKAGDNVVTSAQFLIDSESNIDSDLQRLEASDAGSPEVDHSAMDHSTMDHSKMDHSKMDHSKMDHSKMDHSNMNHAEPKGEHHDH